MTLSAIADVSQKLLPDGHSTCSPTVTLKLNQTNEADCIAFFTLYKCCIFLRSFLSLDSKFLSSKYFYIERTSSSAVDVNDK